MVGRGATVRFAATALLWAAGCSSLPGEAWEGLDQPGAPRRGTTFLGYSAESLYRSDIRTVHIELLGSRDFRRFWEFRLSEAIAKRVELETGWRLAPAAEADAILSGELLQVNSTTFSEEPDTGEVRERQYGHRIRWTFKDRRTGQIMVERRTEFAYAYAFPELNETGSQSLDAAVDAVARRVVDGLKADF